MTRNKNVPSNSHSVNGEQNRTIAFLDDGLDALTSRSRDRGLPTRADLVGLAETYVTIQRKLWPRLKSRRLLPQLTKRSLTGMAEAFVRSFHEGRIDLACPERAYSDCRVLGCTYLRFSADNSNPRSLNQQLTNVLERASRDGAFIPWRYVFADSAISATQANRRGYRLVKLLLQRGDESVSRLYLDEIGRANRWLIESCRLGKLVDDTRRRMIGVTDGFDSSTEQSKLILSMFSMFQEWFVEQLRAKVKRGQRDAFERGLNISVPPFGYRLSTARDSEGRALVGTDGAELRVMMVDEKEAETLREIFKLFDKDGKSPNAIAQLLNEKEPDKETPWTGNFIRSLLRQPKYDGTCIYGQRRYEIDQETGRSKTVYRPKDEWMVRQDESLRIIDRETWVRVQARLAENAQRYFANNRPTPERWKAYPKVLIRPICGSCGRAMYVGRSGAYASYCCPATMDGKLQCTQRGYKARRMLEDVLLAHVSAEIFSQGFIDRLRVETTAQLSQLARQPKTDPRPTIQEIRTIKSQLSRLGKAVEIGAGQNVESIVNRIQKLERLLTKKRKKLRRIKLGNTAPPPPPTEAEIRALLADLRDLLAADVEVASSILGTLLGEVVIHQKREEGKKRPTWIAHFKLNAVATMLEISRRRNCPSRRAWEYLYARSWTMTIPMVVRCEKDPKYRKLATKSLRLRALGLSVSAIARRLGVDLVVVYGALTAATKRMRPDWTNLAKDVPANDELPRYAALAAHAVLLRERFLESFERIGKRLGTTIMTAQAAYEFGKKARRVKPGRRARRAYLGPVNPLPLRTKRLIEKQVLAGQVPSQVSESVGCSMKMAEQLHAHFLRYWKKRRGPGANLRHRSG